MMKCPQCNSLMENYDSSSNDKSQVNFFRCTICEAEHVSSALITVGQFMGMGNSLLNVSRNTSQNELLRLA